SEIDRHTICDMFESAAQENSHYVVLADIAEKLAGRRLLPEEIEYHREMPEWKRLAEVRTREHDWDTAVYYLSEGGGLVIYYASLNPEPMYDDPYRPEISAAMGKIYHDELEHCGSGFASTVKVASTASDEMWEKAHEKALVVGYQRLRMRNEQFGFPL